MGKREEIEDFFLIDSSAGSEFGPIQEAFVSMSDWLLSKNLVEETVPLLKIELKKILKVRNDELKIREEIEPKVDTYHTTLLNQELARLKILLQEKVGVLGTMDTSFHLSSWDEKTKDRSKRDSDLIILVLAPGFLGSLMLSAKFAFYANQNINLFGLRQDTIAAIAGVSCFAICLVPLLTFISHVLCAPSREYYLIGVETIKSISRPPTKVKIDTLDSLEEHFNNRESNFKSLNEQFTAAQTAAKDRLRVSLPSFFWWSKIHRKSLIDYIRWEFTKTQIAHLQVRIAEIEDALKRIAGAKSAP
jgi:hypothetical protein